MEEGGIMAADFNSPQNKNRTFDSFNGTELKCYAKVPTKFDEFGQMSSFELVEMGMISAITGTEQHSVEPIPAIGFSTAVGISVGSSIVAGSLVYETLQHGFINEIKSILKKAGIRNYSLSVTDKSNEIALGYEEISAINEIPSIDIVIIGVKENNVNKKIQKEIMGIKFSKGGSSIGINQLGVREQYKFIAIEMTDFKPVVGATEEKLESSKNEFDEQSFFA